MTQEGSWGRQKGGELKNFEEIGDGNRPAKERLGGGTTIFWVGGWGRVGQGTGFWNY